MGFINQLITGGHHPAGLPKNPKKGSLFQRKCLRRLRLMGISWVICRGGLFTFLHVSAATSNFWYFHTFPFLLMWHFLQETSGHPDLQPFCMGKMMFSTSHFGFSTYIFKQTRWSVGLRPFASWSGWRPSSPGARWPLWTRTCGRQEQNNRYR